MSGLPKRAAANYKPKSVGMVKQYHRMLDAQRE
jgi:hypothetical protein